MESMTWQAQRKKTAKASGGAYDGAFSTAQRYKAPAAVDDYAEIFGGGARGSSIPVLDLSGVDEASESYRSSKIDYANIFGGFDEDLAVPYQELLSKCSSNNNARNHSEKEFQPQEDEFGNCEERPPEAIDPSLDAIKQFNMSYLKTSQGNKNKLNGTTHVAKLHAVPGFTYFVNEPPSKQKTELGMPIPPIKGEVHRTWSFSGNIADGNNRKTEMLLPGTPNAESLSGSKGGSQSTDRSFNRSESESYLKSQSFKTATSSNNPLESFGIRGHPKRSKSSSISLKANPFEKSTSNGTDGSSDEEFDKNSDAAACAAALKRVLEKAQESIRLAKEIRERGEKEGIQKFSNLSSERISKAKDRKMSKFDQETNNSKHGRLGSELYEYNEKTGRLGSRSTGVSTAAKSSQELLTSTEAAEGKSQLNVAEDDGKSKQFLDLVDTRKSIASDLASNQVETDKSIAFLSTRKQESEASLSVGEQESVSVETITAETMEQKEKTIVIETSIDSFAFLSMRKQESVIAEMTSEETLDQKEKKFVIETSIDNDIRRGNAENNVHVDEQTQVSEVSANASDSAPIKHEFLTRVGLEIAEKGAQSADTKCILDELRQCEIKLPECLDMREETKPEPSKTEDRHMLNEWQNPAKEEEPNEGQVQSDSHSEEQKENEFHRCNEGHIVQQETSGFAASDAAPEVCGSESRERTHKDGQEGEACVTSNRLDSCHEGGMVQLEAWGVVASDDAPAVCDSGSYERTQKDCQEVETCGTSNTIQDIGVDNAELTSEHDVEETPTVPYEELIKKVVDYLDPNDKKLVHVSPEEKSTKVHNKEHRNGEDQNISEETYNQVNVDWNVSGEEFDWGEVEKRIKKGCTVEDAEMLCSEKYKISACQNAVEKVRETEETTGVHEENGNLDHDEQIDLVRKAAHENNFDPDAYVRLHDVQEAHSTDVFGDHEASNSTTGTSEEFYNCEWEGNSEEKSLKACDSTDSDKKSDFVHCPSEDHVSSSETSGLFMAFDSDGNGTNPDHNGLSHEHKLPQETVLEATYFVEDAEKDVDIKLKLQHESEDQNATNVAFSADSHGTVTDNNVVEPEPALNPKSGGDFLYAFRQNAEHVNEEFSFDKEDEDVDPKVMPKVENKGKEIDETNSSAVTYQATITQESEEEMITGQNNQFVGSKPQKNALPEDNEARESSQKDLKEIEHSRKIEAMKRERERDKDRIAVERAIREARERAFAEARERAERAAVARAGAEVRQRMIAEAREKLEKASAGTKITDKASVEAKQRAERAAVERATAEARERALEKALSQKSTSQGRVKTDRLSGTPKDSALKQSWSSDLERSDGSNSESAQRRKARLERHERIMERAAKALAEKNMRDLQAQKEQAERNRLAESVDADVKRWANGKEGNLRALLSTLQYILGPDSGWKPISLTEIITTAAVKKAYRKATLYVHPDKLQQRGASIQQKYICEKVFDLLKAAWSKSNSEER